MKKNLVLLLVVIVLIVGAFLLNKADSTSSKDNSLPVQEISYENTTEYQCYFPGVPCSFRYPSDYDVSVDIGSIMIYKDSPERALGIVIVDSIGFIDEDTPARTTEEWIRSEEFKDFTITSEKRTKGGYEATKLLAISDPVHAWVFLTDYEMEVELELPEEFPPVKIGITIYSSLGDSQEEHLAEEIVLSSFKFTK